MSTRLQWARLAELPILRIWWEDEDGELVNFASGVTAWELKIGPLDEPALLTKTSGIVGAAGSGTEDDGEPNVTATWAIDDLDIEPGIYTLQIKATFGLLGDRMLQCPIRIGSVVL